MAWTSPCVLWGPSAGGEGAKRRAWLPALLPALAPARAVAPQRVFRIGAGVLGLQFPCSALAHLPAPGQWVRPRGGAPRGIIQSYGVFHHTMRGVLVCARMRIYSSAFQ